MKFIKIVVVAYKQKQNSTCFVNENIRLEDFVTALRTSDWICKRIGEYVEICTYFWYNCDIKIPMLYPSNFVFEAQLQYVDMVKNLSKEAIEPFDSIAKFQFVKYLNSG